MTYFLSTFSMGGQTKMPPGRFPTVNYKEIKKKKHTSLLSCLIILGEARNARGLGTKG